MSSKKQNRHNVTDVNARVDSTGRRRIQFRFWLDDTKPEQSELGASLEHMKSKRKFSQTIRNALRLFFALLIGDTSVLCELFPGIVESIQQDARAGLQAQNAALRETIAQQEQQLASMQAGQSGAAPSQDFESLLQSIARMERRLETVTTPAQAPETGPKPGGLQPVGGTPGNGGLKPIGGATDLPAPEFDDDDSDLLTVKKDESAGKRASENFIKSMMALQAMDTSGGDGSPRTLRGGG